LKSFRAATSGSRDIARAAGDKGVDIVDELIGENIIQNTRLPLKRANAKDIDAVTHLLLKWQLPHEYPLMASEPEHWKSTRLFLY
jgi:hypothetical protein